MPIPHESKTARAALAKASEIKAGSMPAAANAHRASKRRVDFYPSPEAMKAINQHPAKSLSAKINELLAGRPGVDGMEGKRITTLLDLERKMEGEREIDPEKLVDDLLEFMAGAGHPTIGAAVEDLIARTVAMGSAGRE